MNETIEEIFGYAPKDATHYNQNNQMYYKFIGDACLFWNDSRSEWLLASSRHNYTAMIERPTAKQWSGPEDGLPPVNTVCEYMWNYKREGSEYVSARVLHNDNGSLIVRILDGEGKGSLKENRGGDCGGHPIFRPIKTAEQIAAEKRETAIREFMDVVGIDCRVTASKAVDAGFKREVV